MKVFLPAFAAGRKRGQQQSTLLPLPPLKAEP